MFLPTAALAIGSVSARAPAQAPPVDTIAEARRMRDGGEFASAADLLAPYAFAHPDVPGAAWLAAQTLYWAKRPTRARPLYELALARDPDNLELRVEYARFLAETGERRAARDVLRPAVDDRSTRARALALLGTVAYWDGDLTTARRTLRDALRADSSLADARRQLTEIEVASAPSLQVGSTVWRDDQPLHHTAFDGDARWFATPLVPLGAHVRAVRFDAGGFVQTVSVAEISAAAYLPRAHVDIAAAGGAVRRPFSDTTDWTGRLMLGLRFPRGLDVQARAERAAYLNTTASLRVPVMTRAVAGVARWRPSSGWLGEAAVRRERFPDANAITAAYAWMLAPLLRRAAGTLSAGYSVTAQSAEESRFVARAPVATPPGHVPEQVPGEYNPYYTPRNLRMHSALLFARAQPHPRWSLEANATFALSARDDAPVLLTVVAPPDVNVVRAFYDRRFSPWNVRGSVEGAITEAVRLGVRAEHGRGAYYAFTSVGVQLSYTFVAAARRRAARF